MWSGQVQTGSVPFPAVSGPSLQRWRPGSRPAQSIFSCCWWRDCREPNGPNPPSAEPDDEDTLILCYTLSTGRGRTCRRSTNQTPHHSAVYDPLLAGNDLGRTWKSKNSGLNTSDSYMSARGQSQIINFSRAQRSQTFQQRTAFDHMMIQMKRKRFFHLPQLHQTKLWQHKVNTGINKSIMFFHQSTVHKQGQGSLSGLNSTKHNGAPIPPPQTM